MEAPCRGWSTQPRPLRTCRLQRAHELQRGLVLEAALAAHASHQQQPLAAALEQARQPTVAQRRRLAALHRQQHAAESQRRPANRHALLHTAGAVTGDSGYRDGGKRLLGLLGTACVRVVCRRMNVRGLTCAGSRGDQLAVSISVSVVQPGKPAEACGA